MDLTEIWEVIRRRKWLIIQAIFVVSLSALIGSELITPLYQTSAKIMVKRAKVGVKEEARELIGLPGLSSMIIRTHADVDVNKVLATSRPYIGQLIADLQLRDDNGNLLKAEALVQEGIAATIRGKIFAETGNIRISQYAGTSILEITASSRDPLEARMMANGLADIMMDENQRLIRSEYSIARSFLEEQMSRVKERFLVALREVTEFQKQEKTIDLKLETELASKKMAELLNQQETDIIELAQTRAKMENLKQQLAKQSPDYLFADTVNDSPQIATLKKSITELDLQLTQASSELTDNHPRVQTLKDQIALAKAELKKELEVYKTSAPQLIALERQIAASDAHLAGVNADINKYLKTLGGIPDKVFSKESLGMELNVTQQIYRSLLDALYEIKMGEATTLAEIRLVESALTPYSPVSPNKGLNTVLGIFLGLVFGVALVFVLEYLDDTIRRAEDVKEFRPVTLIGTVPEFEPDRVPLIWGKDPNDPVYESYRKIRNHLKMGERSIDTLLIMSAGPGEGKSTTVVNLGTSVAREGKKVAMVDMDLRRPSLHTYFDLPNEVGMADIVQGKASLDEAIQATRVEGLALVPSGPPFPDPGWLVESDALGRLVSDLRTRFDMVIIDSAPLLIKSDALVLARHVDGSMIILESEKTTRRAVREMMETLARADIRPLGFILNRFSIEKGKYFYHHYYYGRYDRGLSTSEMT